MSAIQLITQSILDFIEVSPDNVPIIVAITFGLSGGIMTLIGLVAIFVSINSQHVAEKCRELLWELSDMTYEKEYNEKVFWKVRSIIELYAKLLQGSRVTQLVVKIAFSVLISVSILWLSTIFLIRPHLSLAEYHFVLFWGIVCSVINFAFSFILLVLNNIKAVGDFPSVEDILDADIPTDVNTLKIAGMTMLAEFADSTTVFFFPIPFKNIVIRNKKDKTHVLIDGENYDFDLSDRGFGISFPFEKVIFEEKSKAVTTNEKNEVTFQKADYSPKFRLGSKVGEVSIHYNFDNGTGRMHYPEDVIEKRMIVENSYFNLMKIKKEKKENRELRKKLRIVEGERKKEEKKLLESYIKLAKEYLALCKEITHNTDFPSSYKEMFEKYYDALYKALKAHDRLEMQNIIDQINRYCKNPEDDSFRRRDSDIK